MDHWVILQILLNIYLCGFVIFYIVSYRKKEFDLLKKERHREESEAKKISETLKGFLKESEEASMSMIDAFKAEHQAIKQSINYINMKLEELNKASEQTTKLLNSVEQKIPPEKIHEKQKKILYNDAKDLLSKGFAPVIVAEKLNIPIGEVELLYKLNRSNTGIKENQINA